MVLDSSGSVRGERLRALKAGALTVIDRLRPRDRAALVSFSHRLDLRAALTGDTATLRRSVATLDADGSTALRDAAFAALALRTAEATRTLVLLFSDGLDTSSILSEDRVHRDRPPLRRHRLHDWYPPAAGAQKRYGIPARHRHADR